VNTFLSSVHLAAASLQWWAEVINEHRSSVFILSAVIAAFSSFLMWVAYGHIKSENWMKYFSWSFGLLSLQYLLLLIEWFRNFHPVDDPARSSEAAGSALIFLFVQLVSVVNNLCAVAAAQDIENESPLVPPLARVLAVGSVVMTLAGYLHLLPLQNPRDAVLLGRSVASVFSAYCLFKVGWAIFANLSVRRHRARAVGVYVVASFYALLQLAYGLSPLLADQFIAAADFKDRLHPFDMLLMGIALPFKFFLFSFAYLLVMRFFETLNEVRKLQSGDDEQRQDYLSTKGIAKLIAGKLGDERQDAELDTPARGASRGKGFVNLIVKLPGEVNKRIACIPWPNEEPEQRAVIFDWPEPMGFSRPIVRVNPQQNEPKPEKTEPYEWEKTLTFAGKVMTQENRKEILWLRDHPRTHVDGIPYAGDMKAIANVAIVSHGAVIGCLQVARSRHRFSQMAVRQLREIANLLSPAVQAYRELASLDQMSIRFAWKQAEEKTFSPAESTRVIAEIIHDVFAPHITRLHMDFGFSTEEPFYIPERPEDPLLEEMKKQCDGIKWEKIDTKIYANSEQYRLLKKQFTARVTETLSTETAYPVVKDRFITGNLILAVNDKDDWYGRTALGITYLHRKAASTLASDAYLDFARDYHNDLLKELGKELSQKRRNVTEWFEPINHALKKAGLSWIVVSQKKRGGKLGDDEGKYILQNFTKLAGRENPLTSIGEIKITHHPLKVRYKNTSHVLRIDLQDSDCHMWLGVGRPGFGPELDFSSPWRTFLVNFAQIADAALSRITLPEKFQLHVEAAQLQGVMASYVTTGTVIHQLSNMIQGQSSSVAALLDAVAVKKLATDEKNVRIMHVMKESVDGMQDLFRSLDRITKVDKHRPCQLRDAALHAFKLFRVSLLHRQIKYEIHIDEGISIDVPFNVAALALANLVGNAKDAVGAGGEITIEAETNGDFALCRVSDNGNGMPGELKEMIFEPKDSHKETGSGLGLYLTYHSLMENRSTIDLTRTGPSGTVFTVKFPLAKEEKTV
jgi:signal transduction histidine kinase